MRIQSLIISGLFLLTCLACEKVIDIDLENSDPQLVIEANLIAPQNLIRVEISRSADYFDNSDPIKIENAEIVLVDAEAVNINVPHLNDGIYEISLDPVVGTTYELSVKVDGVTYTAKSTLKEKIEITEVIAEFEEANGPIDEGYNLSVRFMDPDEEENYYRLIHTLNGVEQKDGNDLIVIDDFLFDGGLVRLRLFRKVFDLGDSLELELIHLDEAGFDYYNSLADIINTEGGGPNGGSAAPGNPNSNWSGNILGYFSAYHADQVSFVVE